jgi:orotidine-5'-phosphate decarboxylase
MATGRDRIIVALDTAEVEQAVRWVGQLSGAVGAFKVGLEFIHAAGPEGVRAVSAAGAERVFFDGSFRTSPTRWRGRSAPPVRSVPGC